MREIVFDTETTGLSPAQGHRIVEIGCVELINQLPTGRIYHQFINPQRKIDDGAMRVHGITNEFVADKPLFNQVVYDFLEFIGDAHLVAHNATFDMGFVNHHLDELGMPTISNERVVDTLVIARKRFAGAKNNLDALCQRFNIDISKRTKHGALLDAELLADVYAELMGAGSNQRNLRFKENKQESTDKTISKVERKFIEPRKFNISDDEKQAHKELLSKIKEPLWESA